MATVSKRTAEWAGLAGEVLAVLLGVLLLAWGWEELGSMLMAIGTIGFVVSSVRLWRGRRQPEPATP
jgi:hypothetical protein